MPVQWEPSKFEWRMLLGKPTIYIDSCLASTLSPESVKEIDRMITIGQRMGASCRYFEILAKRYGEFSFCLTKIVS